MNKIELIKKKDDLLKSVRTLMDKAGTEKRDLTAEEVKSYEDSMREIQSLKIQISRCEEMERLEAEQRAQAQPAGGQTIIPVPLTADQRAAGEDMEKHKEEYRDFGEFAQTAIFSPNDSTLQKRTVGSGKANNRAMAMGDTGILIPSKFLPSIIEVQPSEVIVRPKATVLPSSPDAPDAEITMPVLNQGAAKGILGGVTVYHTEEGGTVTETKPDLKSITLKPHEVMGLIDVTNKLLNNAPKLGAYLQNKLRQAKAGSDDYDYLFGSGVGRALGMYNSPAAIKVTRNTASSIKYADVLAMLAKTLNGGQGYMWICRSAAIANLGAMEDTEGHIIWSPSARDNLPLNILGLPLRFSPWAPAVAVEGGLALVKIDEYIIDDGSPLAISSDLGYSGSNFKQNKTTIRAVWNTDGNIPYSGPIKEGNETMSPVILLKA